MGTLYEEQGFFVIYLIDILFRKDNIVVFECSNMFFLILIVNRNIEEIVQLSFHHQIQFQVA